MSAAVIFIIIAWFLLFWQWAEMRTSKRNIGTAEAVARTMTLVIGFCAVMFVPDLWL